MTCPLPTSQDRKVPAAVSVVGERQLCEGASNVLKVLYDPVRGSENTKKFAVCSKGLDFPHHDISVRLVQWIEISRALGADKIFLYQLDLHPNIVKVKTVKGPFKKDISKGGWGPREETSPPRKDLSKSLEKSNGPSPRCWITTLLQA